MRAAITIHKTDIYIFLAVRQTSYHEKYEWKKWLSRAATRQRLKTFFSILRCQTSVNCACSVSKQTHIFSNEHTHKKCMNTKEKRILNVFAFLVCRVVCDNTTNSILFTNHERAYNNGFVVENPLCFGVDCGNAGAAHVRPASARKLSSVFKMQLLILFLPCILKTLFQWSRTTKL